MLSHCYTLGVYYISTHTPSIQFQFFIQTRTYLHIASMAGSIDRNSILNQFVLSELLSRTAHGKPYTKFNSIDFVYGICMVKTNIHTTALNNHKTGIGYTYTYIKSIMYIHIYSLLNSYTM